MEILLIPFILLVALLVTRNAGKKANTILEQQHKDIDLLVHMCSILLLRSFNQGTLTTEDLSEKLSQISTIRERWDIPKHN